jgi:hypothetical protein
LFARFIHAGRRFRTHCVSRGAGEKSRDRLDDRPVRRPDRALDDGPDHGIDGVVRIRRAVEPGGIP